MIALSGIRKEYSGRCVLSIETLRFEPDKRYALLGANGSGKSTLLKILAKTIKPTHGALQTDISDKKAVGYMPQVPFGFSFSALRNVMIAIDDCPERKEMAQSAIAAVGMTDLTYANASKLSGGEKQRIAFARIICIKRKLLLLDEPTAAADLKGVDLLEESLIRYCDANECSVIFATHSPAQAMRLADEVIFLHHGEIAEQGEAGQVLKEPKSEEARKFLNHWKL